MALWYVIDNLLLLGGSTVKDIRSLADSIKQLEKADKYTMSDEEPIERSETLSLLDKIEKTGPKGYEKLVLRPMRDIKYDPNETEEEFTQRMMQSMSVEDRQPGSNWLKVYQSYKTARLEGRFEELELEVFP